MKMMMSAGKNGRQNSENRTLHFIPQTNLQANVVYKYKLLMTLALACKAWFSLKFNEAVSLTMNANANDIWRSVVGASCSGFLMGLIKVCSHETVQNIFSNNFSNISLVITSKAGELSKRKWGWFTADTPWLQRNLAQNRRLHQIFLCVSVKIFSDVWHWWLLMTWHDTMV